MKNTLKRSILYGLFLVNLGAIIFLWYGGSGFLFSRGSGDILIAFGRLLGLLGEFFILTQLVLIGRMRFIERIFGHDKLNRIHQLIGLGIGITLPLHPILLTFGRSSIKGISFLEQFQFFLFNHEGVLNAFFGILLLLFIVFISTKRIRRKLKYETWYFVHLLLYVSIFLAFGHQTKSGDVSSGWELRYWLILNFTVFGFFVLYRFLRPIYLFLRHGFYVEKIVKESPNVHSIYIKGKNIGGFKFEPGNFANFNFLTRGKWFSHPFSFSSIPNGDYLRISVKEDGDFTDQIKYIKAGTKVIIDGPLGVFTEKSALRDKFLLVAGGIGITPIRALSESLVRNKKDVVLIYCAKKENDLVFMDELKKLGIKIEAFLSEDKSSKYKQGRINTDLIFKSVPDAGERDVYICGPVKMMTDTIKGLLDMGYEKSHIHFEKFSY